MKMLLSRLDYTRVGHLQSVLEDQGIPCLVKNANASAVMGEVPYVEVWPELWVVQDEDFDRARTLLADYEAALREPVPAWTCPNCGTEVEAGFGECWNCGFTKPA